MTAQRNPLGLVEIKGGFSRPRRKEMILTPEQFQQICEKLDEPFRTMVVIAIVSGSQGERDSGFEVERL